MESVDGYVIEATLGEGGFGVVHAAHHPDEPTRPLALKLLRAELAAQPGVAQQFFQEALALARLEHPALPRVLSFGPWQQTYYLVQERLAGSPLSVPPGGLPLDHAVAQLDALLDLLGYIHARGVVHRDLGPSNLLVTPDGALRLLDFGLAGLAHHLGASQVARGLGTVGWSAPEQLYGSSMDPRADLFSAGMLLHLWLTGAPPLDTADADAYLAWARSDDRRSLRRLRPDVPAWLDELFATLTAAQPDARPATAAAVKAWLQSPSVRVDRQQVEAATARMQVTTAFDREAYDRDDDPLVGLLVSVEVMAGARPPTTEVSADLCLVLDVSRSMDQPDKYPLLRQALGEFLRRMAPHDRVALFVFAQRAAAVAPLTPGVRAAATADALVAAMDASPQLFGGATHLAPGLQLAHKTLVAAQREAPARVRRIYVLTDGDLHDTPACVTELRQVADAGIEVHAYGFGNGFDGAALRQLLGDQRGGSVKPICHERDVIETFAHIAAVNQRLIGVEGRLVLDISPEVDVGDGWLFRPQERYLGRVAQRRLVRELGGIETGRVYSALVELRLPPAEAQHVTGVGRVTLEMKQGDTPITLSASLRARRQAGGHGAVNDEVATAQAVLEPLRSYDDREATLRATHARLRLAIAEGRDPGLIEALRKKIDVLEGRTDEHALDRADEQYLATDMSTRAF